MDIFNYAERNQLNMLLELMCSMFKVYVLCWLIYSAFSLDVVDCSVSVLLVFDPEECFES